MTLKLSQVVTVSQNQTPHSIQPSIPRLSRPIPKLPMPAVQWLPASLLCLAISVSATPAQAFGLWTDRSAFDNSLNSNATVIDSDGAFAADPTAANGLAHIDRSGYIESDFVTAQA